MAQAIKRLTTEDIEQGRTASFSDYAVSVCNRGSEEMGKDESDSDG